MTSQGCRRSPPNAWQRRPGCSWTWCCCRCSCGLCLERSSGPCTRRSTATWRRVWLSFLRPAGMARIRRTGRSWPLALPRRHAVVAGGDLVRRAMRRAARQRIRAVDPDSALKAELEDDRAALESRANPVGVAAQHVAGQLLVAGLDDLGGGRPPIRQLEHHAMVGEPDIDVEVVAAGLDEERPAGVAELANRFECLAHAKGNAARYVALDTPGQAAGIEKLRHPSRCIRRRRVHGEPYAVVLRLKGETVEHHRRTIGTGGRMRRLPSRMKTGGWRERAARRRPCRSVDQASAGGL